MYGYIYKFTFLPTGDYYVGKHKYTTKLILDESYWGSGIKWTELLKCYDKSEWPHLIKREILEWCETKEQLNKREIYWVDKLNATNDGFNISPGGDGGNVYLYRYTQEEIDKVTAKRKQYYIDHPDVYERFCESCRRAQLGSKKSDETKLKLSKKMKSRWDSDYDNMLHTCVDQLRSVEVNNKRKNSLQSHYDNMTNEEKHILSIKSSERWGDTEYRKKQTKTRQTASYKQKMASHHPGEGYKFLYNEELDIEKRVPEIDIQQFLDAGYRLGRRPFSKETKKSMSMAAKNRNK